MLKYLDPKGGRTTSNLETSVARALYSLTSVEGRAVCGLRGDDDQLDMVDLIRRRGTMYLLGEPDRMRVIRPLLSMIADEMFQAAEDLARLSKGTAPAFYAILDELRSGVRVATLPDIASEKRKFRIGYLYACTNGGDEAALYGDADAARHTDRLITCGKWSGGRERFIERLQAGNAHIRIPVTAADFATTRHGD